MSKLKKRQHYVWRNYLKAWSKDEKIWTYFKESSKIEFPNLMRVAQEKYFYELPYLDKNEIKLISSFIDESSIPVLKDLQRDLLTIFTMPSVLHDIKHINPETLTQTSMKEYQVNAMEDIHCVVENWGLKLIQCRSFEDIKSLNPNSTQI